MERRRWRRERQLGEIRELRTRKIVYIRECTQRSVLFLCRMCGCCCSFARYHYLFIANILAAYIALFLSITCTQENRHRTTTVNERRFEVAAATAAATMKKPLALTPLKKANKRMKSQQHRAQKRKRRWKKAICYLLLEKAMAHISLIVCVPLFFLSFVVLLRFIYLLCCYFSFSLARYFSYKFLVWFLLCVLLSINRKTTEAIVRDSE